MRNAALRFSAPAAGAILLYAGEVQAQGGNIGEGGVGAEFLILVALVAVLAFGTVMALMLMLVRSGLDSKARLAPWVLGGFAFGPLALGLSVGVMVLVERSQSNIVDDGASFFLPLITLVGSYLFFAGKRMARP